MSYEDTLYDSSASEYFNQVQNGNPLEPREIDALLEKGLPVEGIPEEMMYSAIVKSYSESSTLSPKDAEHLEEVIDYAEGNELESLQEAAEEILETGEIMEGVKSRENLLV